MKPRLLSSERSSSRLLQRVLTATGAVLLSAALISCSGGGGDGDGDGDGMNDDGIGIIDDNGGIIGTGIRLKGTVPTERAFARSEIEIRSQSGESATTSIASNGRFSADEVTGDGPYLMRVDLGNGDAYYGVAHALSTEVTQNVHAYSDLAIRNWFAGQGLDIDSAFNSSGALATLPTATEIGAIDSLIQSLIGGSLAAYSLGGTDLGTVSFDSNDAGVDRFLDRNPIVIVNNTFTIIIADPGDGGTQTVVSDGLAINTDLTSTDTEIPSAPTGLRVLPSATNEIVVAWESSSDNIGVAAYEIVRDGTVIGSTPYPVYFDSPLEAGVTYSYSIVAVDATGNRSALSNSGMAETLALPDTVAPPSPANLQLVPGVNSVQLSWQQTDISDVASFIVRRGTSAAQLLPRARVTSTFATDGGLNSGVEYCYQVIATDASENDSAPTPVLCATTGGGTVTSAPVDVPMDTTPPVNVGGLAAVDVSGLSCTQELVPEQLGTNLDSAVTLQAGCYLIERSLTIASGGQMTLAPGTVFKFAAGARITVVQGGSLTAVGTATAPIVFTAQDPTPGFWDGLLFNYSNSTRNQLEHVVLEYGGSGNGSQAGLETTSNSSASVRLSLSSVLLRRNAGPGFDFDDETIVDAFTQVVSTENLSSGTLTSLAAATLGADNDFSGNTVDGVTLTTVAVDDPITYPAINVPWLADTLTFRDAVMMPAGTEIQFEAGGGIRVEPDGSLNASGTAAQPILFTGTDPSPGHWDGLLFAYSNSGNNSLEHVTIEYAGGGRSALETLTNSGNPTRLAVDNVTLQFNAGLAFDLDDGSILSVFSNNIVTSNDSVGELAPTALANIAASNSFTGNGIDEILLTGQRLEAPITIPDLGVPYEFSRITSDDQVVIAPGVTMIADAGAEINIESSGSFTAVGTASQPISFIGRSRVQGYWDGIELQYSNSPANQLEFVTLSDAGGGTSAATAGNVRMLCNNGNPAQVSISNSTISDSLSWGVYSSDCSSVNLGAGVIFTNNLSGDVPSP